MYYAIIRVASGPNMTGCITKCATMESAFKMKESQSAEVASVWIDEDHTKDLFGDEFKIHPIQYNEWSLM